MPKDITKNIMNDLDLYRPADGTPVEAQVDLTTWLARKIAQDRQVGATSEPALYAGNDILDDVRTWLNGLTS